MSYLKARNTGKGFSLIEMLISMVIFSIVMGIIYSFLLQTRKDLSEAEVELTLTDSAQTAVNALRKDLYQIGVGRDVQQEQPQILRAGMFDLIFCSDLDREIRNPDKRYGCPDPTLSIPFGAGSPFRPLYFLHDPTVPEDERYTGWDPNTAYGYRNLGAEIVRYSLDSNQDNIVNHLDLEDNIVFEGTRQRTTNPNDFWLFKEWWGCVKDGSGYRNEHSGVHPVAFNVRGLFYSPEGKILPEMNKRHMYPSGVYPSVLFTYWGHFWDTLTVPNDPSDPDWPGEPLDLWGDWGNQDPVALTQPIKSGPDGARNGVLDMHEIERMMTDPLYAEVNLNYMKYVTGVAGESPEGDENGNGIPGENRLDQFIRRIGVNIVVEASSPNPKAPNLNRSNTANPEKPVYYYYKDYEIGIQINPRNLVYSGSPEVDMDQLTPTPIPTHTPTPFPTDTPDPSLPTNTPTTSPTPDPASTHTPTPNPNIYDANDGEVIMGGLDYIYARSIYYKAPTIDSVCDMMGELNYFATFGGHSITHIKPANFCDPVGYFDAWNDLVFATNSTGGSANLFYYKNIPGTGIDGFTNLNSTVVGYNPNDRITSIAAGNLGPFGYVHPDYDEVAVAYHRYTGSSPELSFIEIYALNLTCGDLIPAPYHSPLTVYGPQGRMFKDMVIADFSGNGVGELAVLNNAADGSPQITIYKNIASNDWSDAITLPPLNFYIEGIQCAKLVVGSVLNGNRKYVEPDLIVVAENGQFAVLRNARNGTVSFTEIYYPGVYSTIFDNFNNVAGAVMYDASNFAENDYWPVLAVAGNSDEQFHLAHYDMRTETSVTLMTSASGPLWYSSPLSSTLKGLTYVPLESSPDSVSTYLVVPARIDGFDYVIVSKDPVTYTSLIDSTCSKQLLDTYGGINCITSTRNALSQFLSYMPTPTPEPEPTP